MLSFISKVEARYRVVEIEAGLTDQLKSLAKKATLALIGLGFSGTAFSFSGEGLKTYAKEATKLFQKSGIDCRVDAKVHVQGKKETASLTYKCQDGSSSQINIVKVGDRFSAIDMKSKTNDDGYVNPKMEGIATAIAKMLAEDLKKSHLEK